jgi:hypothetical protein
VEELFQGFILGAAPVAGDVAGLDMLVRLLECFQCEVCFSGASWSVEEQVPAAGLFEPGDRGGELGLLLFSVDKLGGDIFGF